MHKTEFYVHDLFSIKHNNAQMFENVQYDMNGKCCGYRFKIEVQRFCPSIAHGA